MEASAGVLRRFPSVTGAGVGVSSNPLNRSCSISRVSLKSMGCGFYDEGCLEYYSSGRGGIIRCGKKKKNKEKDMAELKKTKKKMKLLKGLTKNLSNLNGMGLGFGCDVDLVDQVQGKTISEAAELLLGQLQQLKAEEKELKRKRKEEKAQMKMKVGASEVQSNTRSCAMSSSSSSSSESSDSSDDECQNLVDMKSLKIGTLAQTIPEACGRALENATLNPSLSTPEVDTTVEISSMPSTTTEESTGKTTSLEFSVPEEKGECCLVASDCHIGNVGSSITPGTRSNVSSIAAATTTTAEGTKRIEVCMGGKCKRLGAGALLEEFQRVAGIEAAVSGCKCMGKCKVGPNVKVSGCSSSSSSDAFPAGDSVAVSSAPTTSNSLCIRVGLEDVSLIAANLLGRYQEVGLANALP
ncbi:diacylglycerol O-acyltransferase 3, cytosolic [Solanum pennellii]|uniref:Diacylglycerol O-acyltransferase 3, cytosolic n=1 Tax=Solanum pennellii TaxID=28526 RepID=A0ABM1FTC7_SOLPN|nr:diacylglycerol O-acyltransferase 3, cytosolic [Solanum pennellii]